jgi:hypothetical protein
VRAGQLGVVSSSRRYKEDIQPMGEASERLLKLRPVTFRYKNADVAGAKPLQYGLIAEEVAEVFPELVVYNKEGQPETVQYQALAPILINEVQQQQQKLATQDAEVRALTQQVAAQEAKLAELSELKQRLAEMQALLVKLRAGESIVAHR